MAFAEVYQSTGRRCLISGDERHRSPPEKSVAIQSRRLSPDRKNELRPGSFHLAANAGAVALRSARVSLHGG